MSDNLGWLRQAARKATGIAHPKPGLDSIAAHLLKLGSGQQKSFVASPACLQAALEALARGAEGETLAEIDAALGGAQARVRDQAALYEAGPEYEDEDSALIIGASVWANSKKTTLRDSYARAISDINGEAQEVDFASRQAHTQMSKWLAENTNGKFKNAPKPNRQDVLTLMSALYFKGTWVDRLDDVETRPFFAPSAPVEIDMMRGCGSRGSYIQDPDAVAIAWPMRSGASAVFAMPTGQGALSEFIESGSAWSLIVRCQSKHDTTYPEEEIDLTVPGFELTTDELNLKSAMEAMGIRLAFTDGAQLGGITKTSAMLDSAVQNSVLNLDENGVEGASFTMFRCIEGCPPDFSQPPVEIVLDHPFAFAIFSKRKAPLFVGVYQGN